MGPQQTFSGTRDSLEFSRTYAAPIDLLWELWTTKEGIESWWGPDGFSVSVEALDLKAGGMLAYTMTAIAPEMVGYMISQGMPVSTRTAVTYKEIVPFRRLAYVHHMEFVPGVEAYDVAVEVQFVATRDGVRLDLTSERMHDAAWTERAASGWRSQLSRLDAVLAHRLGPA